MIQQYCLFFVPIASLLSGDAITGAAVWIRIVNKFFWLLAAVSVTFMRHLIFH